HPRHVHLIRIGDTKAHPVLGRRVDRLNHRPWRMTQYRGTPGADKINHLPPVHIPDSAALGPPHKEWISPHIAKGTHWRVHPARDVLFSEIEKFGRKRSVSHDKRDTLKPSCVEQNVFEERQTQVVFLPS